MIDSRYRASKDLYDAMERHDKWFMRMCAFILLTIIAVLLCIGYLIWKYI